MENNNNYSNKHFFKLPIQIFALLVAVLISGCDSDNGADNTVNVPDIIGMTETDASGTLENSNFSFSISHEDNIAPIGQVIRQTPAANSNVKPGTEVEVVVSDGVPIPNVVGSN